MAPPSIETAVSEERDGGIGGEGVAHGFDGEIAARHGERADGLDRVVLGRDRKGAGLYVKITVLSRRGETVVSPRGDTVVARLKAERGGADAQAVVCADGVGLGLDRNAAAGDHQVVLGDDTVQIRRSDRERAAAVDGEIVVREDHAVRPVALSRGGEDHGARHAVVAPLGQGQKDLFRLVDTQAGVVRAAQLHAVEEQPDLGGGVGVDDHAAVGERAGEHEPARAGDDHVPVVGVGAAAGDGGAVAPEGDDRGAAAVPGAVEVVGGEIDRAGVRLIVLVHDDLDAETLAEQEQDGEQKGEHEHDNADGIKVFVR